jgi:lipopolysaccharide/colanic/teichoic acid biosynthesis glycosyltransferase
VKRFFDFVLASIVLFFLTPVMLIIIFLIKKDGGAAIFVQKRVGINGSVFNIYKFRSMIVNADALGGYSTLENDNRITAIGRVIRKTSIDELPQLFNVLNGTMSIVGPRPNVPAQKSEYSLEQWDKRNSVPPGITGLAQATKRSAFTFEERLEYDLNYVDNHTFLMDVKIIMMTVKQVFLKGGY